MNEPKTITVTKTIPAPPDGYEASWRYPKAKEEFLKLSVCGEKWVQGTPYAVDQSGYSWLVFAYRIPKPKRLMTPQELAGKWLHMGRQIVQVTGWRKEGHEAGDSIYAAGWMKHYNLQHEWQVSDTPTSEPRSLEVEDDK